MVDRIAGRCLSSGGESDGAVWPVGFTGEVLPVVIEVVGPVVVAASDSGGDCLSEAGGADRAGLPGGCRSGGSQAPILSGPQRWRLRRP
jgi:hypothetical protein